MSIRYEIIDHDSPRPDAEQILFCDGTGGKLYQSDTDLELSHWRTNRTPAEYRAGTSTEICFRFLDAPRPGAWTVAVNNHVDVDGMLSVYTLVHRDQALAQRATIVQAAEMGDFWGWGEPPAQRLFQGLTRLMNSGRTNREIYEEAFRRVPGWIAGIDPETSEIEASLAPLRRGVEGIEQDRIRRTPLMPRLTQYLVPLSLAGEDDARAAYVPEFNEAISEQALLWPQARARQDAERLCLVSTERPTGWWHDLWAPGYLWADTEGLWRVPGLTHHADMSHYDFDHPPLLSAIAALQEQEAGSGQWTLGGTPHPLGRELHKRFPLVGRFLDPQGQPAVSRQSPEQVAPIFAGSLE